MKKIKLEILGLSSSQSQTSSFALVLGETEGNRRLPIIIGMFEAQAIAIEIEKIIPLTNINGLHVHLEKSQSPVPFSFEWGYTPISKKALAKKEAKKNK